MKKTRSLKDLIDSINWEAISPTRGGSASRLGEDQISVAFVPSKKGSNLIDKVKIRFGSNVLMKLKWQPGDKVIPFNDPDDLMTFLICKTDGHGWKISQEPSSHISGISFKWDREIPLEYRKGAPVVWEHNKGKIIFRVD